MKFLTVVNMLATEESLARVGELHARLWNVDRERPPHMDLNQQLLEVEVDIAIEDVQSLDSEFWPPCKSSPEGVYQRTRDGETDAFAPWIYVGPGMGLKVLSVAKPAKLLTHLPQIPHIELVAAAPNVDFFDSPVWYSDHRITLMIETYAPKWSAKGFLVGHVDNLLKIVYIPVTVNVDALQSVVETVMGALATLPDKLETVFQDHGTNVDFLDRML